MSLSYLRTDGYKQTVTHIRESRRFKSMYTLQGKPDQHVTCIPHSIRVWSQTIHISRSQYIVTFQQSWTESLLLRKKEFPTTSQHVGWSICGSPSSFSPTLNYYWSSKESQASIDSRLLALSDPYHWYAIGTFNTYSRGPTHRCLTDTDGVTTI
jgi:hypothetical protein